jgi:uncharacterized membrane protein YdbT with pleckstrin-like domain
MTSIARLISRKPYETQVFALRRHWVILAAHVFEYLVLAAIPIGVYVFFQEAMPDFLNHPTLYPLIILTVSASELGLLLLLFTMFLDYQLDLWVVTNDRLISIEQLGLFARTVAELDLWRIQDVTSDVQGIFPTLFGYGNVHVQTAGATERFILEQVPDPYEVRKIILDMADLDRKFHQEDDAIIHKAVVGP